MIPIFDLDGTLLDSDAALDSPFVALGIDPARVEKGLLLVDVCAQLGIEVDDYLRHYDVAAAMPYDGIEELLAALDCWAVCSNKQGGSGRAELARLRWQPDVMMFAEDFGGPKTLPPVLDALGLAPADVIFVGDTSHDRACAEAAGCAFAIAGWNPRCSGLGGGVVLARPLDLLAHLG